MKKILTMVLAAGLLLAGCGKIYDELDSLDGRVSKLEQLCKEMNEQIGSIKSILSALQENDYVKSVTPVMEGGQEVGYTITFTKSKPVTIRHGTDGSTPQIGVKADSDGLYYWTLNGGWLVDASGDKIIAEGIQGVAPQLKIEGGYWYVSYDDGKNWTRLQKAQGEPGKDGDSFFSSVVKGDSTVTVTLSDGTVFTLPLERGPMEFVDNSEQLITDTENKVTVRINDKSDEASFVVNIEPFDAIIHTKAAGEWKASLAFAENQKELVITLTPDTSIERVMMTVTRIVPAGSHRISKILACIPPKDLSRNGTANSYIVSEAGEYIFPAVKGNSHETVGTVASAEVLWESFGTSTQPNPMDLISNLKFKSGRISFSASDKKGNAVIAAKNVEGNILWSWHIWMTDVPEDQVYNHSAGTMMDRNLGATSAAQGDVRALGLLYQWGRKDPFLGSADINGNSPKAVSSNSSSWKAVHSDSSTGTIDYAVAHPTVLIGYNSENMDWLFTGSSSTDDTRWTSFKTVYDPCPPGYRVPDGGPAGVWAKALGSTACITGTRVLSDKGHNFATSKAGKFFTATAVSCWYPFAGEVSGKYAPDISVYAVGANGIYWSCTPSGNKSYVLYLQYEYVWPISEFSHSGNYSVRCLKE